MNSYAAISSIGFGETLPVHPYIPHSKILRKSLIGVPCSVFNPLQRSLIGVPCSVFIPLQRSLIGVPCSVFIPLQRSLIGVPSRYAPLSGLHFVPCSVFSHTHHSDPEPNWYIYHSDHLGSSAFLTDASGDPTQHLQYMPFGETFVEQRSTTSYYTPYTFSAKERDTETGYSYFGARYYDADISVWLSVDPMADKYPSMSAYMYCAGNPVMLVDPDGMQLDEPSTQQVITVYTYVGLINGYHVHEIKETVIARKFTNTSDTERKVEQTTTTTTTTMWKGEDNQPTRMLHKQNIEKREYVQQRKRDQNDDGSYSYNWYTKQGSNRLTHRSGDVYINRDKLSYNMDQQNKKLQNFIARNGYNSSYFNREKGLNARLDFLAGIVLVLIPEPATTVAGTIVLANALNRDIGNHEGKKMKLGNINPPKK
jgi:RHS repeat-associated protein